MAPTAADAVHAGHEHGHGHGHQTGHGTGRHGESEAALRRVRHLSVHRATLRAALVRLVNATRAARDQAWWGKGTACARATPRSSAPGPRTS
nr:Tn3 family transposase [Streptomyces sp. MMBL 11-1]